MLQRYGIGTEGRQTQAVLMEMLEPRWLQAADLPYGLVTPGSITASNQTNVYTFHGTAGDKVELQTIGTAVEYGFRAQFDLFSPASGVPIWHASLNGANTSGPLVLPATGEYQVQARDSSLSHQGTYSIGLEGVSPVSPDPIPLVAGGIVSGAITAPLDVKQYVFTGTAGDSVQINTIATQTDSGFRASFALYAPSGALVSDWSLNGAWCVPVTNLPENGQYLLQVADNGLSLRGTYSVGLEGVNPVSPSPLPLISGGVVDGSIATALDVKQYVFTGAAGNSIWINTIASAIDSDFRASFSLYAPSGALVTHWSLNGPWCVPVTNLAEDGQYLLEVADEGLASRGNYSVGLEGISPISPAPIILPNNKATTGQIGRTLDVKQYVFAAQQGDDLSISTVATAIDSGFRARFALYAPSGAEVTHWSLNGSWNVPVQNLSETGQYMLLVCDDGLSRRGSFTITGLGLSPTVIAPPFVVSGNGLGTLDGDQSPDAADGTDFGQASTAKRYTTRTFTITNISSEPLQLTGGLVVASGANSKDFRLAGKPARKIPGGGMTTFTVKFDPSVIGLETAVLSVTSLGAKPYTFSVQGTGLTPTSEISLWGNKAEISNNAGTASLTNGTDFGTTGTIKGVVTRTFTIRNDGTASLILGTAPSVVLSGANPGDFILVGRLPASIAPGKSASFKVRFHPLAAGVRSATVTVISDDADNGDGVENPFVFAIQGAGVVG